MDSVWSNDKSESGRVRDEAATRMLLEILSKEKYQELFKDSKTKKASVWNQVAADMIEAGFPLNTDSKSAGQKCDQKYRNLERQYKDFVQHSKTTGKGRREKPEFYDEIHALCGGKHTVKPVA